MPINDVQTTNKQHAVPQNIMDVEFKIIGELTMRQFAYLMVFGGLAFISASYVGGIFKWPFVLFFIIGGLAFAFVPIEDRGMDQWVVAFFRAVYSPTQKIWRKEPVVPSVFLYQNLNVLKQELVTLAPTSSRRKLEEYLDYQKDSIGYDRLDIPEAEFINKVREAYSSTSVPQMVATYTPTDVSSDSSGSVTIDTSVYEPSGEDASGISEPTSPNVSVEPPVSPEIPIPSEIAPNTFQEATPQHTPATIEQTSISVITPSPIVPVVQVPTVNPTVPASTTSSMSSIPPVSSQPMSMNTSAVGSSSTRVPPVSRPVSTHRRPTDDIKPVRKKVEEPQFQIRNRRNELVLDVSSRERHTGRRFTNLLATEGEIVLPIRGEKTLKTTEEIDIEKEIQDKTEQLKKLINQIKSEEGFGLSPASTDQAGASEVSVKPVTPEVQIETGAPQQAPVSSKPDFDLEANTVIESVKNQNKELEEKISALKDALKKTDTNDQASAQQANQLQQQIKELELSKTKTETEYSALQRQLIDLQQRLKEKESITPAPVVVQKAGATSTNLPAASTKPNVISGIVKNPQGVAIDGVVLIVKNQKGEAVRATKSNALGQFSLITPLGNGIYTVEVGQYNKVGLSFDIISVEAKGDIIPPLVFQGR